MGKLDELDSSGPLGRGATLEDVAHVAGVSRATVSRVVRGDVQVRRDKVAKVEQAVRELGYVPNNAARSLASRQTGAVALIVPEHESRVFTDPFFVSAISGVTAGLDVSDKQLLLVLSSPEDHARTRRFLRGGHADGLLVVSHHEGDLSVELLQEAAVPVVFIGRPPEGLPAPFVDLDNIAGGRLAARHLIERGRRRIAMVCGPQDMPAAVDRREGFEKELADAGIEPAWLSFGDFTLASGERETSALLESGTRFDALFASSDLMALGALKKLEGQGMRVPEDVAVIGFDDIASAADDTISLTTVINPGRHLAELGATMLLDLIAGRDVEQQVVLCPELAVRSTT
ncbi:LacI family DNA-binding transcriptional regulator [Brachybacterium sp. Z12]|uniref:LacI family DNA-binding transcriptional regulator n=1 Tax=Brachybacterium sp. Z12 TaxID=2759167 RepID=UPI001862A855|nr:LacI family DNA-binding transcriptional regulator [Brachybacterium sp. Z12]QNN81701.1 LacI family DNA-binding transcriptional regulator [Brachybacterium sp. Z12]